jgi:ribose-phosphate pyrophosphokinase
VALIVAGEGAAPMARRIADATGWATTDAEFKTFPDGEAYARIPAAMDGQHVVIVQTGYPPERFWRLLLLLNAARENRAASVRAVVPYLAYARQDRLFQPGEALSSRLALECVRTQASGLVTVDPHKEDVARFFGPGFRSVSAEAPFADAFRTRRIDVVLAPDAGARPRAAAVAARLAAAVDHLEKKRLSGTEVEVAPKTLDVRGKRVAILDDIISTGGTMAKAVEQLVRQGAASVLCAGVHGLFLGDAADRLRRAGASELLASDSIETEHSRVSVAGVLASALLEAPAAQRTR